MTTTAFEGGQMPTGTANDRCPHWCTRDHSGALHGTDFYHASETSSITLSGVGRVGTSGLDGVGGPDWVEVQIEQHLPDEAGEPAWTPTIEVALHAGGRYRLLGLTPEEAGRLAAMLARAASMADSESPGEPGLDVLT
jgi:hypothetical protein